MDTVLQYFGSSLRLFRHPIRPSSTYSETNGFQTESKSQTSTLIGSIDAVTDTKYTFANDRIRSQVLAKAKKLVAALEKPEEVVFRQAFESHTYSLCLRLGVDLKIFHILVSQKGEPISAAELAKRSGAQTGFLVRIMRVLTVLGYAAEAGEYVYMATPLTAAATIPALEACVVHSSENAAAVSIAMPTYFATHGYKSPTDRLNGPFQYALNTPLAYFDYLHADERKMRNFNTYMTANRGARKHWVDWFPVHEVILSNFQSTRGDAKALVDMGGGKGRDISRFLARFPESHGRLVLQDLAGTTDSLEGVADGIQVQSHDLFTPQPVLGAKAYYTHFVLHDFADSEARLILQHTRDAMEPGYSRLLLNEIVIPERDCPAFFATADITMMAVLSGLGRDRAQWTALVESVGLQLCKIWESPEDGDCEGVIEAMKPVERQT